MLRDDCVLNVQSHISYMANIFANVNSWKFCSSVVAESNNAVQVQHRTINNFNRFNMFWMIYLSSTNHSRNILLSNDPEKRQTMMCVHTVHWDCKSSTFTFIKLNLISKHIWICYQFHIAVNYSLHIFKPRLCSIGTQLIQRKGGKKALE